MVFSVCLWMDNWASYFHVLERDPGWSAAGPAAATSQNLTFFSPSLWSLSRSEPKGKQKLYSWQAAGVSHIRSISTACLLFCVFPPSLSPCCAFSPSLHGSKCGNMCELHVGWTHICMVHLCTCKCRRSASHLFLSKAQLCIPLRHFHVLTNMQLVKSLHSNCSLVITGWLILLKISSHLTGPVSSASVSARLQGTLFVCLCHL